MFSKELEDLIQATLADGVLTEKEKLALVNRAEKEGVDLAELEIYIDSLIQKRIQSERITKEEKAIARDKERKGNVCPHCGTPIPPLTKTCPSCGAAVGSNETVGDKELTKLVDDMEEAIVNLKCADHNNFKREQAVVESLLRKAKTFYGDNKKVQVLVFDLEQEEKNALERIKKDKYKALAAGGGKAGTAIAIRCLWGFLWFMLVAFGMSFVFLPFLSSGFRGACGDLWRKAIGDVDSFNNGGSSKANSDIEKFENKFLDLRTHGKNKDIQKLMRGFRVPDDKEGLLGLLGILEPILTDDEVQSAWNSYYDEARNLFKQAQNKARSKYRNDPDFEHYLKTKTNSVLNFSGIS